MVRDDAVLAPAGGGGISQGEVRNSGQEMVVISLCLIQKGQIVTPESNPTPDLTGRKQ